MEVNVNELTGMVVGKSMVIRSPIGQPNSPRAIVVAELGVVVNVPDELL